MLTTEVIEDLRAAAIIDKHLADTALKERKENETLRQMNADASRLASQEATAKHYAEEHLGHLAKFIGLHGMTWAHVVSEAVSLIERQKTDNARVLAMLNRSQEGNRERDAKIAALTAERDALSRAIEEGTTAPKVEIDAMVRENQRLAAEVDRLRSIIDDCQSGNRSLHGRIDTHKAEIARLQQLLATVTADWLASEGRKELVKMQDAFAAELAEARAENGRQAATIALARAGLDILSKLGNGDRVGSSVGNQIAVNALEAMGSSEPPPVRIETIHTCKESKVFWDWMEAQPFYAFRPDAWLFSGEQSTPPRDYEMLPGESLQDFFLRCPQVAPTPKLLRLEVGKTYVRRDGQKETIAKEDAGHCQFRFIGASANSYREDGRFCPPAEHSADLVAEVPAEDVP